MKITLIYLYMHAYIRIWVHIYIYMNMCIYVYIMHIFWFVCTHIHMHLVHRTPEFQSVILFSVVFCKVVKSTNIQYQLLHARHCAKPWGYKYKPKKKKRLSLPLNTFHFNCRCWHIKVELKGMEYLDQGNGEKSEE